MTATEIEWADVVWNPTTGCDRVSPGCDNCYALTMARRALAALVGISIVLALASCTPADDPDRCVPPSPSPTGAPWVETDDGEPCVPGPDGWTEQPDGHRVVAPHRRATVTPTRRAVTQPATTKKTTKARRVHR